MGRGKNINLFLMDGRASGRIKCTLANWTGVAYKIPRTQLDRTKGIDYLQQTGIYLLFGTEEESGNPAVYIGQAGIRKNGQGILNRLQEHTHGEKTYYWTEAVALTTSNNSFGPTEISYLENRFHSMALASRRYRVQNEVEPPHGNVTEEKESELEEFIDYSRLIMGALGYKLFEPLSDDREKDDEIQPTDTEPLLFCRRKGIEAMGRRSAEGFVLLKGSQISQSVNGSCSRTVILQRERARAEGRIDANWRLLEDILFTSPSGAAQFAVGGSANGLTEWKDGRGTPLKELESKGEA
ncbi:MAG: methionine sulfoxide reductase [Bacteroidia bacterium]|nr:MAG: methionine sulfoxide reductase [Bacteroidia bacterium]